MGKLHENVAVADDMRGLFDKLTAETKTTFTDRKDHFVGLQKSYESAVADDFKRDPEVKQLVTTVSQKMKYFEDQIVKIFDANFQREATNCIAKADIIVTEDDGSQTLMAETVPVTFLLQLEKQFTNLRNAVYNNIPTLDPTKVWSWDGAAGFYVNKDPISRVTRKILKVIEKVKQDDKHAGQAEIISTDETCGYYNQVNQSGMTTPVKKSQLLAQIDKLLHAIKTARARANETEVVTKKIGQDLFNYLGTQAALKE